MTKRAGVIGTPVGHSISPAIFQAAFVVRRHRRQRTRHGTRRPICSKAASTRYAAPTSYGANVTIPHKQAVIPFLDGTSDVATLAGAVNTIVHADGKLAGHNTDVAGFARSLKDDAGFDAKGKHTVVLGSGGASRAVALALVQGGASTIFVIGRSVRRDRRRRPRPQAE